MKKMKVFLSLCLMACMLLCFAPMRGEANAECPWDWVWDWYWGHDCRVDRWGRWYEVSFTGVKKTDAPGYSNFSFYYNQWAKTLIVRGTGDMPVFDKDHPAPWADLKDKAERVILERNITTISAQAFENFTKLKSVVLPSTLKSIDPKAFVKCENLTRLEYAGDLDNLDRVLKACGTKELTEARVVKLTEKQIKDEVWQLTWYRVGDDRIEYDRFGRPIRIVWTTPDGYRFDTAIKYLNETATNIRSEDVPGARDVVKKNETTLTFPNGFKTRSETEKNDLGQTSYASNVILDSRGRPTVGSQSFRTETGTYKTGDLSTTYYWNGSSTRTWDNTIWTGEGGSEKVVEQVNAFGQVMSVSTTTYDPNDKVVGTSETNNSYDLWGNLIATSTTSKDSGGTTSSTTTYSYDKFGRMVSSKTDGDKTGSEKFEYDKKGNLVSYTKVEDGVKTTVEYTYDKNGQKIQKTEKSGGETVRTDYTIGEKAGTETSNYTDDEGNKHKSETNYSYKGGVVSERTVKDTSSDGSTTTGKDTFNAEGLLVSSVRETVDKDGNKTTTVVTYTYDAQGRQTGMTTKSTSGSKSEKSAALAMLVSDEAASSEAKAAAMVADEGETETITTVTLDPETGVKLSEVQEVRTANYTSLTTRTFSIDGKELSVQSEITEKDGSSSNYAIDSEYDDDGKLKAQKEEISDFNNNKETSDYLYEDEKQVSQSTTRTAEDGTQTQTVSTRTYSDDGSSVDSVTEKDEDGAVTGTYTVFHDAPEETIPAAAEMTADQAKEASSGKPEEVEEEENSSDGQVPQGQEMENSGTENSSSPVSVIADAAVPLSLNSDNSGSDTKAEIIIEDPAADQTVKTDDAGKEMEKTANEEPVVKEEAATETADILFEDATAEAAPKVDDTAKNETNDAVNPAPKSETTMKESVPQSAESVSNQEPAVVEAQTQEMVPEVKEDAGLPVTEAKIETAETVPAAAEQQQPVDILAAEKPNAPAQPAIDQGALLKAAEEKSLQEAAEKAAKATEEKAAQEAAEKAAQEAAEKAAKEAAEKAQKEAEEKARKEAEEKARKEAEEKARKEAEEKARKEAEEKARKEAEEKARKEAEEKARKEAEEKARKEAAEKAAKEAAEKAAKEAAEKAAKDAAAQNAA